MHKGSACVDGLTNTSAWLSVNLRRFSQYATYADLLSLNAAFSGFDVLHSLTVKQLAQLTVANRTVEATEDLQRLLAFVTNSTVAEYIDELNRQVNLANSSLETETKAVLLQHVLMAARPILQAANDTEFTHWMNPRLAGLIPGLNRTHVPLFFEGLDTRTCTAVKAAVTVLNNSIADFGSPTQHSIYQEIRDRTANSSLQCYTTDTSFAVYLRETFQGFGAFLNLRDLRSIIPASGIQKIANTMAPAALADLFSSPAFLNDDAFLTALVKTYERKGDFIDQLNKKSIAETLPGDTRAAILAGVWPAVVRSDRETEVDAWLSTRLSPYFSSLQSPLLSSSDTLQATCTAFRKIVDKLSHNSTALKVSEREVYHAIQAYLTASPARPRCYNASNPKTANWFAAYLGHYIRYSSAEDVRSFTNNDNTALQDLAINRDNLRLINHTQIPRDTAELYATSLFAKNANFSLINLPGPLLCFARHSTAIQRLSSADALSVISRINLHCGPSSTPVPTEPTLSDHQLATMLVAQVTSLNANTLTALGQQALGLTFGQISKLRAEDVAEPATLQALGQVHGWNRGQAQGLVNKVISSNFTLDTAEAFHKLGTLLPGLPGRVFSNIPADTAKEMAKNEGFSRAIKKAPRYLKRAFVDRIISRSSSLNDILHDVPDALVDQVPISLLVLQDGHLDLHQIQQKQWSAEQAAVFFERVLTATENRTDLSASVLHGFQCSPASKLSAARVFSMAEQMTKKNVVLTHHQLSCLAKILAAHNLTANFTHYPRDLLLFFNFTEVHNDTCKAFYTLASQGNLSLLPRGSAQRTQLLTSALACLEVENTTLSKEQLGRLGALVCDMDAAAITDSHPRILENLKLCPALTEAQQTALNARLGSGESQYGDPSSWDLASLQKLGPLAPYVNHTTWSSVNVDVRRAFFKSVVAGYQSQSAFQKKKAVLLLKSLGVMSSSSRRPKRAPQECMSEAITAETILDPLFLVSYTDIEQFDVCLSNEVLKDNLVPLLEQPLTEEQLDVLKRKFGEIYPDGIPENQLKLFGLLSRRYTASEISKWMVTSSETLVALLDPEAGSWREAEVKQLVARYVDLGGNLTGPLLQQIGGEALCNLSDEQIKRISPEAIGSAGKLDISSCSQAKKDQLYAKARDAFASQKGTSAYYPLIQPYLGGAPVKDLEDLAKSDVAMDINTFTALNPDELQKLSIQDVKNLLGVNLPSLKQAENHPAVANWTKTQYQSALDRILGIGLQGGMPDPISTATSIPSILIPNDTTTPPATSFNTTAPTATTPSTSVSRAVINPTAFIHNATAPPPAVSQTLTAPSTTLATTTIPDTNTPTAMINQTANTPKLTTPAAVINQTANTPTPTAIMHHATNTTTPAAITNSTANTRNPTTTAIIDHAANITTPNLVISETVTASNTTSVTATAVNTPNAAIPSAVASNVTTLTPNTTTPGPHIANLTSNTTTAAPVDTTAITHNTSTHHPSPIMPTSPTTTSNATAPPPIIFTFTTSTTPLTVKATITSTVASPTTPRNTARPPTTATTSATTTVTTPRPNKTTSTKTTQPTKPTPVGFINLKPVTTSRANLSFSLLHVLSLTVGIFLLRRFL
ncbi:PREDICTED: uncharacterized protein LOC109314800 [Crocodylus porosus]|uniref:uncharacterized protein LOC109314800 n=1 Tax=Crocodylus porosus TaxID=8502 RepID=UPI00093F6B1D|nr:PREDICTED: uncharacterized protein LOC109314800 [Crocodylus porosus]